MEKEPISIKLNNPRYIIGIVLLLILIGAIIGLANERIQKALDIEAFYKKDVNGIVLKVEKNFAGFNSIYTMDGQLLRFYVLGESFFKEVAKGDTIVKPSYADTLKVFNRDKQLKFSVTY